jgi:hypothetical protein
MKRIGITGLFLAAVFAFSAGAASSASAAELLAKPAGGGSIAGTTFLSSVTLPLLTTSGSLIHCKHATNHGLFLSPTLGNILIRFLECTTTGLFGETLKCKTTNAGTGEIHLSLETLFHLGLAHLTPTVGKIPAAVILLGKVIKIECEGINVEVRGNVIGALQRNGAAVPLNTAIKDVNLNFQETTPTSHGSQHLRLFLMPGTTGLTTYDLEANPAGLGFKLAAEVANALLDGFKLPNGTEDAIEFDEA